MKKLIPIVFLCALGLSSTAFAQTWSHDCFYDDVKSRDNFNGGFDEGLVNAITVTEAQKLTDKSRVVLRGSITKQVGKNEYTFKDKTGEITIEVDRKAWRGQSVTPKDFIEITGEVDKSWSKIEIEVSQVKLMPQVK